MRRWMVMVGLLWAGGAGAFSPAVTTEAGIRLEIPEQAAFTTVDQARPVAVKVTNEGPTPAAGSVRLGLIDSWRVAGPAEQAFDLAPQQAATLTFQVVMGAGTYRVFYPIHATATVRREGTTATVHTVLVVAAEPALAPSAAAPASDAVQDPAGASLTAVPVTGPGATALARTRPARVVVLPLTGAPYALPPDTWVDSRTRGNFSPSQTATRGDSRPSIGVHPPWAAGLGDIAGDYRLTLPNQDPITFECGLAIRDHSPTEPGSDGVTFRVQVATTGAFQTVAEQHTAAKVWSPLTADLSAWKGRTVTLRLVANPGPARNTSCDSGFFGGPVIRVGRPPAALTDAQRADLARQATQAAQQALRSPGVVGRAWALTSAAGRCGVGVAPGPLGLLDGQIAFATQDGVVVFDGFQVQVSGALLADLLRPSQPVTVVAAAGGLTITHHAFYAGQPVAVQALVSTKGGSLQVAWSMPGTRRDDRGHPRYTHLALGVASAETKRAYFGHGHVLVGCPRFSLGYGGFAVTTRYVGVDYANGVSLVTATDPVPDRFEHDQARRFTSLVAHHDATFTFVPSASGAFAGARVWRQLADLRPAPSIAAIRGKMCLDQWGGDYGQAAQGLTLATKYGLDDAVFVKHVWQRWGYDYRLPDIYPPAGNRADFDAMVKAAKLNGRLFALHDNYIDFYPDATGFSYDHISFQEDGQPRLAWLNEGRNARSYKWNPQAFLPFLEANLKVIEREIDPSSYFIDVWSAAAPVDQYDRAGRFYPKMVDQACSAQGFDRTRELIGGPVISEAGHDALIGHLEAAQADHLTVTKEGGRHIMKLDFEQWDRVPWFDMGHHGNFILFAGGLGGRYQAGLPTKLHGYGSDDYLSLTVLGGRTPMSDGPFSRRAVMTYWLLQPICNELERQELLAHAFDGENVRRQRVTWSNGQVTVNRAEADWPTGGVTLPSYGFQARAGEHRAEVVKRDGVICAKAQSPGLLFVDARPPDDLAGTSVAASAKMTGFKDLGNRRFEVSMAWQVDQPVLATARMFVHFCGPEAMLPGWQKNADILFQGSHDLTPEKLGRPGSYAVTITGTLPELLKPGELAIRFGLFEPSGGNRLSFRARPADEGRYDGGTLTVTGTGAATSLAWRDAPPTAEVASRDNLARRVVDFGEAATNGAFRLAYGAQPWVLTLLPGSRGAEITLRPERLGAARPAGVTVEQLDLEGQVVGATPATVTAGAVRFTAVDGAFQYRIRLR